MEIIEIDFKISNGLFINELLVVVALSPSKKPAGIAITSIPKIKKIAANT
ncbi:hypothetical protein [Nonlabens sp. Asnod3-A02]